MSMFVNFVREETGATAGEYAILLALVTIVIAVGAGALGANVNGKFTATSTAITP